MEYLISIMPVLKMAFVFICMIVGIRYKLGVAMSIGLGAIALSLVTFMPLPTFAETIITTFRTPQTIYLGIVVALIMLLSGLLENTGQATRIMDSLKGYLTNPRFRLVFFPALIGLLPMPGGAIFSAPMLNEAASSMKISNTEKAVLNYWFRHIWELSWPLYPGMLLASSLSGMTAFEFSKYMLVCSAVSILFGWFFYLRPAVLKIDHANYNDSRVKAGGILNVVTASLPLLVAIVGSLVFEAILSVYFPDTPFLLGIIISLVCSIFICMAMNEGASRKAVELVCTKRYANIVLMVLSIFIFKDIMNASGIIDELSSMGGGIYALVAAATLVPFLVGFISGVTFAYAGASIPLVLGLLHSLGLDAQAHAWIVLSMFFGFAGIMSSPLHICFLLTCEYFKVDVIKTWRKTVIPGLLIICVGVAYFWVLV